MVLMWVHEARQQFGREQPSVSLRRGERIPCLSPNSQMQAELPFEQSLIPPELSVLLLPSLGEVSFKVPKHVLTMQCSVTAT